MLVFCKETFGSASNRLTKTHENKFVIIGKNIDKKEISEAFQLVIEKSKEGV